MALNPKSRKTGYVRYETFLAQADENVSAEWADGKVVAVSLALERY